MGTFKTKKILDAPTSIIPQIAKEISGFFTAEEYITQIDVLLSGAYDISISKGNLFKSVLGMNTALKIHIRPLGNQISIEAGAGIFGQQAIPTAISLFLFWPVLATQIWGLVQQSKLDEKAIEIAEKTIKSLQENKHQSDYSQNLSQAFCIQCGKPSPLGAKFCAECGHKLE